MGDKITLKLDKREVNGKKVAVLRRESIVPGVVYGPGMEPVNVQAPQNEIKRIYSAAGKHAPVHLTVDDKKRIAMIKDIDIDHIKNNVRHISFHAVKASDPVVAEVPVRLIGEGESEAEKAGLIVLQALDKVEVKALPMDLPDAIEIDITELKEAGEKVTLADAKLDAGVEFVEHDDGREEEEGEEKPSITDLMVASVWEPAALQAQNEATAGTAEDESEVESEQGAEAENADAPDSSKDDDKPKQDQ